MFNRREYGRIYMRQRYRKDPVGAAMYQRIWRGNNPSKAALVRHRARCKRRGITLEQYDALLSS